MIPARTLMYRRRGARNVAHRRCGNQFGDSRCRRYGKHPWPKTCARRFLPIRPSGRPAAEEFSHYGHAVASNRHTKQCDQSKIFPTVAEKWGEKGQKTRFCYFVQEIAHCKHPIFNHIRQHFSLVTPVTLVTFCGTAIRANYYSCSI